MSLFESAFLQSHGIRPAPGAPVPCGIGVSTSGLLADCSLIFHLRAGTKGKTIAISLPEPNDPAPVGTGSTDIAIERLSLFPWEWTMYRGIAIELERLAFTPLLPGQSRERCLPLRLYVYRLRHPGTGIASVSLMATLASGVRSGITPCGFDFQHDNLALTGSLEVEGTENRIGIAMPDLHDEGIYLQGIEPWEGPADRAELWLDFKDDGEIDPRLEPETPAAAAWVKFELAPGEMREIPFALVWHEPRYESGPFAGAARQYTRHLRKRRSDNAIVWLAEQAFQTHGGGAAAYTYWMRDIADWQERTIREGASPEELASFFSALGREIFWDASGRFAAGEAPNATLAGTLWPDLASEFRKAPSTQSV